MNTCATCRHWTSPSDRTGFGDVVQFARPSDLPTIEGYAIAREAQTQADKLFGECAAIYLQDDLELGQPVPLAVAQDGSNYRADVYTQAEFGCAMWEPKAATDVPVVQA